MKKIPEKIERTGKPIPAWLILATIFITGNVVMMLEVVGTRVVGPYFGVGLYVWSALITVTLLALAGGYWVGGKWADVRRNPATLYLIILGAAIFILVVPSWRYPVLAFTGKMGVKTGVLIGSMILFGPPLFLLGMVTPFATKLYTEQFEKLGTRVGFLYAISTLGSFIGTLGMGFYLIPNFHLPTILISLGVALLLLPLCFFLIFGQPKKRPVTLLLFLAGGLLYYFLMGEIQSSPAVFPSGVKIVYKTTSFYGEIKVLENQTQRVLLVDGVTQSGDNTVTHQAFPPYVTDLDSLMHRYQPQARDGLILGLGGGNMVHCLLARNIRADVVEIDAKIKMVAEKYFAVDPQKVHITLDDGRRFIRHGGKKYDVIILNTFSGENFPDHMLTREFFQEVNTRLKPGGITLLNFVGYVEGPHRQAAQAVYATLKSANAWCKVYFRGPKQQFANTLYVAGHAPIPIAPGDDPHWMEAQKLEVTFPGETAAVVCTDDYNPVEFLNRVVSRRWRQLVMDSLGPEILLN